MDEEKRLNPELWVDLYGDVLFRFALARVSDRGAAEDLVQETFLAALRSGDRFKGRSSEKTWMFAIIKHKIVDYYRKKKTRGTAVDTLADVNSVDRFFDAKSHWHAQPSHWSVDPGKAQEAREFLDHLYRCLAGLPQRNAEAFIYREIDGLSTRQICKRLDITASNCWVMLYRARVLLRECLDLAGFGKASEGQV